MIVTEFKQQLINIILLKDVKKRCLKVNMKKDIMIIKRNIFNIVLLILMYIFKELEIANFYIKNMLILYTKF